MIIPIKKLVLLIFFWLETTFAFFNIDDKLSFIKKKEQSRIELKTIFGYDFYDIRNLNGVLVWKISMDQKTFKPQDYSDGFTEFETDETYLILAQNCEFTLFYWVGMETTLEHKKYVAKYAALMFMVVHKYRLFVSYRFNFAREDEIFESESFIHALDILRSKHEPKDDCYKDFRDNHFPLRGPNLYLVKEDLTRSSIQIPVGLGLQLLSREMCLVVYVPSHIRGLHPASAYCSNGVNDEVRWRAQLLVASIRSLFDIPEIVARGSDKYKALVELFENKQFYRTSEILYLEDSKKIISDQDEEILLFKVSVVNDNDEEMTIREAVETPVTVRNIESYSNYILDSKCIAGVFFVHADNADVNDILWTIQNAEEYLHNEISLRGRPIRMRITRANKYLVVADFKMNLTPLPPPPDFRKQLLNMTGGYC